MGRRSWRMCTFLPQGSVTGVGAVASATLSYEGQVTHVQLVEQSRGEIRGMVLNSYGTGCVPGAIVTLNVSDGMSPPDGHDRAGWPVRLPRHAGGPVLAPGRRFRYPPQRPSVWTVA